ncbi:MAG: hypothetical protein JSR52_10730 [Planctomycetes bacterium]|nr:hypothetical protein [Planctomycetota bacterium]
MTFPEEHGENREMSELLARMARGDADSARETDSASGRTLEDRVFASTVSMVGRPEVVATIGASRSLVRVWRVAAVIGLVALGGVFYNIAISRSSSPASPTTPTKSVAKASAEDVEFVLAAVSLLDEPLGGSLDDAISDATKLRDTVGSDRTFSSEPAEDKPSKQGV